MELWDINKSRIPKYPSFKEIELGDKPIVDAIFRQSKPYCDFAFVNLYIWRPEKIPSKLSNLNGNLVIKTKNILTSEDEISFLGISRITETVFTLLSDHKVLKLIPEIVAKNIRDSDNALNITEDWDNSDYIMSLTELADLSGYNYSSKRKDINKLDKTNLEHRVVVDMIDDTLKDDIYRLYFKWVEQKKNRNGHLSTETEFEALKTFLETPELHINFLIASVYENQNMVSFTLNELCHDQYVLGSFAKADYNYYGASSYSEYITANALKKYNFEYLNHEQDLGLESLRRYKLSWNPVGYLRKYIVETKQQW